MKAKNDSNDKSGSLSPKKAAAFVVCQTILGRMLLGRQTCGHAKRRQCFNTICNNRNPELSTAKFRFVEKTVKILFYRFI